jgi:hypothetical protein
MLRQAIVRHSVRKCAVLHSVPAAAAACDSRTSGCVYVLELLLCAAERYGNSDRNDEAGDDDTAKAATLPSWQPRPVGRGADGVDAMA